MRPNTNLCRTLALTAGLLVGTATTHAQTIRTQIRTGETILQSGIGVKITQFSKLTINDRGFFYSEILSTHPVKITLLLNGFVVLAANSSVASPAGARVERFMDLDMNNSGFIGWPLDLKNTTPAADDRGIFWNTTLLARENNPLFATDFNGRPFASNSTYKNFFAAKINDRNSILFTTTINDPSIPTPPTNQQALSLITTDGAGTVTNETFIVIKNLPFFLSPTEEVEGVFNATHTFALNNKDGFIAMAQVGSDNNTDSLIFTNDRIVLREGDPSGVPGRLIDELSNARVAINDLGDTFVYAFLDVPTAGAQNNNAVMFLNDELYAREGDLIPGVLHPIDKFDAVPCYISRSGDTYWYVATLGPPAENQYYMRNYDVIMQEGTTVLEDGAVRDLRQTAYAFQTSNSGRFWLAEVTPASGGEALVLADFGTLYSLPGCTGNASTLSKESGDARAGATIELEMTNAQSIGAVPILFFSAQPSIPNSECGTLRPLGEVMISLNRADLLAKLIGMNGWDGSTPLGFTMVIPNDPSLVDFKAWAQGIFCDLSGVPGVPKFQLTNGFYFEIGAP